MKTKLKDIINFLKMTRVYYPHFNPSFRYVLTRKWDFPGRLDTLFCPEKIPEQYQLYVTERILELPFVHRTLRQEPGSRILEFGCTNSALSIKLASRGLEVVGIDLRQHTLTHPNFTFYQGDFFNQKFTNGSFNAIIAVSAVEHVGLGAYGETKNEKRDDHRLVEAFRDLLVPGGQFILTVPFGVGKITPRYRIYDSDALSKLTQGFHIEKEEYYRRVDFSIWLPTSREALSQKDWDPVGFGADGLALISALR